MSTTSTPPALKDVHTVSSYNNPLQILSLIRELDRVGCSYILLYNATFQQVGQYLFRKFIALYFLKIFLQWSHKSFEDCKENIYVHYHAVN